MDIGNIGFIIIVMLVYSGCTMYMLQLNSNYDDESSVVLPVFENFLVDSFLSQYMLVLGEFHTDGF